jgi:DNA transposition AAA+ family ATPase
MKPYEHKNQLTPEQELIILKVESRLAAGLTEQRLSLEAGVDKEDIGMLLDRHKVLTRIGSGGYSRERADENTDEAIRNLAEWLSNADETAHKQSGFAVTPTYQSIHAIIANTHKTRKIAAITGSWGIGKSKAAKSYAETYPRGYKKPGSIRIEFTASDKKPAAAYSRILGALRGKAEAEAYRNVNLHNAIGATLSPADCLILDECNHLKEAMEIVRSIHDDFGVAIVMIGNPEFTDTVWGKKSRFEALASRAMRFDFPASTPEDVEAWVAWKGILEGKKPGERTEFLKKAIDIAKRPGPNGGLRTLAQAVEMHASLNHTAPIDGAFIEAVANQYKKFGQ